MNLVTLDYETYYDTDYSLSKISIEDYVTDPRFEIIGVGLKLNDDPTLWHSGPKSEIAEFLRDHAIDRCALLCQNTMFDQMVNQHHFNIYPPLLLDTMCMAQAILKPFLRSVSLSSILKHLNLGVQKGTYLAQAKGKHRVDFSGTEIAEFADYCKDDCEGEYRAFHWLNRNLPREELHIIDMTLRMYFEPQLELDVPLLEQVLEITRKQKSDLLEKLPAFIQKADLMSNPKLAELLNKLGVEVPMKISPTTDKPTFAFAKNDPEWKDMEEAYVDDPLISSILMARLGVKSTIAETRAERLVSIGRKHKKFRVPLKYYAAHTGRYGGTQKINPQNFPRIRALSSNQRAQIRYALKAPKHHVVLAADLKQIEARKTAWIAGCHRLVNAFKDERDVYAEFASIIYHRTITKEQNEVERFVGKTCILGLGFGMGWKKLRGTLRKDNIKLLEEDARHYVNTYRRSYIEIPAFWGVCDEALSAMAHGGKFQLGPCMANVTGIELPNGMKLFYHKLRWIEKPKYTGYVYDFGGRTRTLWGGKITENIIQALARIKIMTDMRAIKKQLGLQPVLQAHDELVYVVLEKEADYYSAAITEIMSVSPSFAPDLPIGVDVGYGPTYGDAK